MGDAALNLAFPASHGPAGWPYRIAQQVFAALLEDSRRLSGFRVGARRGAARAALSALSVDDRGPLERWLALQLVTSDAGAVAAHLGVLATVDALLAAGVRVQLPRIVAGLGHASTRLNAAA